LAKIYFADDVAFDFKRILVHLREHASSDGIERLGGLKAAIEVLTSNPLIGRPCADGCRELIVGRGMRGYVALYHYDERTDLVKILAIRSQRESGYQPT
jgi:toxin ParE1/3/4